MKYSNGRAVSKCSNIFLCHFFIMFGSLTLTESRPETSYACDSKIYCQGNLLHAVQTSGMFPDSKTFVDMPMAASEDEILREFEKLFNASHGNIPYAELEKFVNKYFYKPENELVHYDPPDWTENPKILAKIADDQLRAFASSLNYIWKELSRKMNEEIEQDANQTSLIYIKNPFVVPGDRFREFYYWDSYWIINGLLLCDMKDTVKGIIQNYFSVVKRYGMIPNGGRIYYSKRSQPPFLTPMVKSYFMATGDLEFLNESIPYLEMEYNFWISNRQVNVTDPQDPSKHLQLFRYNAGSNMPRPEGYKEDYELVGGKVNEESAQTTLHHIASACESGWDFSSRWFKNKVHLQTIETADTIPVDLNAIICGNEKILSNFFSVLGNSTKAAYYRELYHHRVNNVTRLLWNDTLGFWFDYNMTSGLHNERFTLSSTVPLYTQCVDTMTADVMVIKLLEYLKTSGALDYPGGVPATLNSAVHEQWDFPNAWPPNVHMMIEGLASTGIVEANQLAYDLASNWIKSNWKAWMDYSYMYEKFDVRTFGVPGGGGEYSNQKGFGWSNGAVLMLLNRYGSRIFITEEPPSLSRAELIAVTAAITAIIVVAVLAIILAVYWNKKKSAASKDISRY